MAIRGAGRGRPRTAASPIRPFRQPTSVAARRQPCQPVVPTTTAALGRATTTAASRCTLTASTASTVHRAARAARAASRAALRNALLHRPILVPRQRRATALLVVRGRRVRRRDGLYQLRVRPGQLWLGHVDRQIQAPTHRDQILRKGALPSLRTTGWTTGIRGIRMRTWKEANGFGAGASPTDRGDEVGWDVQYMRPRASTTRRPKGGKCDIVNRWDYVASPANGGADWEGWFPHSAANTPFRRSKRPTHSPRKYRPTAFTGEMV